MKGIDRAPYYDTYRDEFGYLRLLFVPGRPIQARELTEIQTILQSQIEKFGSHIFKDGTPVYGGALSFGNTTILKVDVPEGVSIKDFDGKVVNEISPDGNPTGVRAKVRFVAEQTTSYPAFVEVEMISDGEFTPGNTLMIDGTSTYVTIQTGTSAITKGQYAEIQDGVFFINGFFVVVPSQRIIVDPETDISSGRIGLEYVEQVVTEDTDKNLLDPAFGASSYSAPGAHRLILDAKLKFYRADETPPDNFVEIVRVIDGKVETIDNRTIYDIIGDELARRTYEESGDYTVERFDIRFLELERLIVESIKRGGDANSLYVVVKTSFPHNYQVGNNIYIEGTGDPIFDGVFKVDKVIDDFTFTYVPNGVPLNDIDGRTQKVYVSNIDNFVIEISPGVAFVRGYEIVKKVPTRISVPRARSTKVKQNHVVPVVYNNALYVTNVSGYIRPLDSVTLLDANGVAIGSAIIRYIENDDTTYTSTSRWRVSLFDFKFTGTSSIKNVRKLSSATFNADVHGDSIDANGNTFLLGGSSMMLFPVTTKFVKSLMPGGVNDTSFTYYKKLSATSNAGVLNFSLFYNDEFIGSETDFSGTDLWKDNYVLVAETTGLVTQPTYAALSGSNKNLEVHVSTDDTYHLFVKVRNTLAAPRTKVKKTATIVVPAANFVNGEASLGYPDVFKLVSVKENGVDVTADYTFDSGQRDNLYDHGSIIRKDGQNPQNDLEVTFEWFEHIGDGYFSVDSYKDIGYDEIPAYMASDGTVYPLTDVIDFRPTRMVGASQPKNDVIAADATNVICDVEYFVGRYDRLVLTKEGAFVNILGKPDDHPKLPEVMDDAMLLYDIYVPSFTFNVNGIRKRYYNNRRYTMKDIGKIDKRVKRVENYTAISLLEMRAKQEPIYDKNGLERFKNGFIVDDFGGFYIANTSSPDFTASIDLKNQELRPSFKTFHAKLEFEGTISNAVKVGDERTGDLYMLPYTEELFLENLNATKAESVNHYLVTKYKGVMYINPQFDDQVSETVETMVDYTLDFTDQVESEEEQEALDKFNQYLKGQWLYMSWDEMAFNFEIEGLKDVTIYNWNREIELDISVEALRPNVELYVFVAGDRMDGYVTPLSGYEPQTGGLVRSDAEGKCKFKLLLPEGRFRTGALLITVIDEQSNIIRNCTTYAQNHFYCSRVVKTSFTKEVEITLPRPRINIIERPTVVEPETPTCIGFWGECDPDYDIDNSGWMSGDGGIDYGADMTRTGNWSSSTGWSASVGYTDIKMSTDPGFEWGGKNGGSISTSVGNWSSSNGWSASEGFSSGRSSGNWN